MFSVQLLEQPIWFKLIIAEKKPPSTKQEVKEKMLI